MKELIKFAMLLSLIIQSVNLARCSQLWCGRSSSPVTETARLRPPGMSLENSAEGAEKQRRDTGAVNQIDPKDTQRRSPSLHVGQLSPKVIGLFPKCSHSKKVKCVVTNLCCSAQTRLFKVTCDALQQTGVIGFTQSFIHPHVNPYDFH